MKFKLSILISKRLPARVMFMALLYTLALISSFHAAQAIAVESQTPSESGAPAFLGLPTALPHKKPEQPPAPLPDEPTIKPVSFTPYFQPLSDNAVRSYRDLFAQIRQEHSNVIPQFSFGIDSNLLQGHVLAERLLAKAELQAQDSEALTKMLKDYADHPQAQELYDKALSLGLFSLPVPTGSRGALALPALRLEQAGDYAPQTTLDGAQRAAISERVKILANADDYDAALALLDSSQAQISFDPTQKERMRAYVASHIYYDGDSNSIVRAYELASQISKRQGGTVPLSHWIAGLAAWRMKYYEQAQLHFSSCAGNAYFDAHERAACGFWQARALFALSKTVQAQSALEQSMNASNTLYGLLSALRLNKDLPLNLYRAEPSAIQLRALKDKPQVQRAFALLQIDEVVLAEQELLGLARERDAAQRLALLRLGQTLGMPRLASQLAYYEASDAAKQSAYPYPALYPFIAAQPSSGFSIDRALLWAIARKESFYNSYATGQNGAKGLRQDMPRTVEYMIEKAELPSSFAFADLLEPGNSLQAGQAILNFERKRGKVDNKLVHLLIAYNAGYGNFENWLQRANANGDPLLLMESLPASVSRDYVHEVLRNFIIYRALLDQEQVEAKQLALGQNPELRWLDHPLAPANW